MEHVVPREKWLYNDRGMMKWMGWILADHSAYIENEQAQNNIQPVSPVMDLTAIDKVLQSSWQNHASINLQLNILENNNYLPELIGEVVGFEDTQIYLQLINGNIKTIQFTKIRSVKLADNEKWWSHDDSIR